MEPNELARRMLEWQEAQAHADLLKMEIEAAVLELGKTQTVGSVRATYSAGRKSYDYEAAWRNEYDHPPSPMFQRVTVTYDYKSACVDAGIQDVPFTQGAPSVSLKVIA
ncbi:MAG TPA: hypothetical protein PLQ85_10625 [Anaerolineae bacterium]|mgnify:CR=1 FL=1|nr:hypothetical protein [Anaerolineae bacterium]